MTTDLQPVPPDPLGVPRVTVAEVKERMDRGEPILFLDTRSVKSWSDSDVRIPGSMRVPPDDVAQHLQEIPQNRSIVTWCT